MCDFWKGLNKIAPNGATQSSVAFTMLKHKQSHHWAVVRPNPGRNPVGL